MSYPRPSEDSARRVRAAAAYSGLSHEKLAQRLLSYPGLKGDSPSQHTVRHWGKAGIPKSKPWIADELAKACGLPPAFFYADFSKLPEIVPATNGNLAPETTGPEPGPDEIDHALRAVQEAERDAAAKRRDLRHLRDGRPRASS